jgi:hypothetical protein
MAVVGGERRPVHRDEGRSMGSEREE